MKCTKHLLNQLVARDLLNKFLTNFSTLCCMSLIWGPNMTHEKFQLLHPCHTVTHFKDTLISLVSSSVSPSPIFNAFVWSKIPYSDYMFTSL